MGSAGALSPGAGSARAAGAHDATPRPHDDPLPTTYPDPQNPTLENNAADVHYETDFRSVYARIADNWLGADSRALLNGDFRRKR